MPAPSLALLTLTCALSVAVAAHADPPADCAEILPAAEVTTGQKGTGWTVVRGIEPQPFDVTILGVLTSGISSGHDLAIIEIADKPGSSFVGDAGGIWAGMSGSPVYVGGRLAGAVSYTFSQGPSKIGGMTLAEDMMGILAYDRDADAVPLPDVSRAIVENRLGVSLAPAAASFSRIPLPIVASSITASASSDLETMLGEAGVRGILTPGASVAAPGTSGEFHRPVAGGNFAAAVSYGDLSIAALGTATYVCGDQVLAFGHPFALAGAATFGANDADAFAIVDDPTLGPFKLGAVGAPFGLLDEDRIAAVRATTGVLPPLLPVTADLRSSELQRRRVGTTHVTAPLFMRSLATSHLLDNIVAVTDSEGGGSAVLHWTVRGKRSSGQPFELRHSDRVTSDDDVALAGAFRLLIELGRLDENVFEDVEFREVSIRGRVSARPREDRIYQVEVSRNGGPFDIVPDSLAVRPGDELALRIAMRKPSARFRFLETRLTVPEGATGRGQIVVAGGSDFGTINCAMYPDNCPDSLPELIEAIEATPRTDDVVAELSISSMPGRHWRTTTRHRAVVRNRIAIDVTVEPAAS